MSRIGKSMEWESRLVVAGGWGEEGKGRDCSWVQGFFGDDENVLELVVVAQCCDYTKNHWIVHFKRVNFMVCELYIYKVVIKRGKKMVSAFSKFHGNRYLKVPWFHTHAVQSMASAPWPRIVPTAKHGLFDLVWRCLWASLPFKGTLLTLGLLCVAKDFTVITDPLLGGQATYCKVQDEKAMAAVQPSQVVMESGDVIGCQRFGANDLTYRVKQLGYKGRHPGSGTWMPRFESQLHHLLAGWSTAVS